MLANELFDQVPPMFHELPEFVLTFFNVFCATLFSAARSVLTLAVPDWNLNPVSALFQAVLRVMVMDPVLPLSVKPSFALANAMLLRTMCEPATSGSPPPSLKPLPSPAKSEKPQLSGHRQGKVTLNWMSSHTG